MNPQSTVGHGSAGEPARGTVLGFDFGEKRVGVAVGELELALAHPLTTITAESDQERLTAVERLVKEWSPVLFVVGLPMHLDGSDHELAQHCRRFARRLHGRFGRPARLVDERLTSASAGLALAQAGVHGRRQNEVLDQVAAQEILQAYFSARFSNGDPP